MPGEVPTPEPEEEVTGTKGPASAEPDMTGWTPQQMQHYYDAERNRAMLDAAAKSNPSGGMPGERYVERSEPQPLQPGAITEVPKFDDTETKSAEDLEG